MNNDLHRLYVLAQKPSRLIIGLMSGTSLDGLDIVLCKIDGFGLQTQVDILAFRSIPYTPALRLQIKEVFAQQEVSLRTLSGLHASLAQLHAQWILQCINDWGFQPKDIDLIASHGQTVFHAPQRFFDDHKWPNNTFQLVDGDHIAWNTGIITVSDFRQKHVAAGGEGAPLALYGDYILFRDPQENRILLNLGGIGNITYLPKDGQGAFASDTGPANTLINQYMEYHFQLPMDKDASLARKGKCHPDLLAALLDHPYFAQSIPKTTGPEQFHLDYLTNAQTTSNTKNLSHEDLLATLHVLTARSIALTISQLPEATATIYVSGGGFHNPLLMQELSRELPKHPLKSIDVLGVSVDAKEAVLFALLANERVAGDASLFRSLHGAPAIGMGKISFPR
jgi:anhydro-N-acetylmuramic acid kinase